MKKAPGSDHEKESAECTEEIAKDAFAPTDVWLRVILQKGGSDVYGRSTKSSSLLSRTGRANQRKSGNVASVRSPTEVEAEYIDMPEFVKLGQATLLKLKTATEVGAEFGSWTAVIKQAWPETKAVLPLYARLFSLEEGTDSAEWCKGEKIVIL